MGKVTCMFAVLQNHRCMYVCISLSIPMALKMSFFSPRRSLQLHKMEEQCNHGIGRGSSNLSWRTQQQCCAKKITTHAHARAVRILYAHTRSRPASAPLGCGGCVSAIDGVAVNRLFRVFPSIPGTLVVYTHDEWRKLMITSLL